jgi:Holliday junction resolvasome RuvABC endonuclease subunit
MTLVGFDLGVHKIAGSVFTEGDAGFTLYRAEAYETDAKERDVQLMELAAFAYHMCTFHDADSAWIEKPIIGNNRKYSMQIAEVYGAVLSDLAMARMQGGLDTRSVDNKVWKKEVLGSGNASKDDIRNYIHDVHPAYAAFCGDDQDRYDATCIGVYGLGVLERAQFLRL